MEQIPIQFGLVQHLVGFYRSGHNSAKKRPAVLFWNTGLWNQNGPQRLNTEVALELCDWGFASFCFDTSARGAAQSRSDLHGDERTRADVGEAIDLVCQRFGHREVILFGVCSSALDAHAVAAIDPRVSGLIMIDTYTYRSTRFRLHYYLTRIKSLSRWRNFFTRKQNGPHSKDEPGDLFEGIYPSLQSATKDLEAMIRRNLALWVGFTGGFRNTYSYIEQFRDSFAKVPFGSLLALNYFPLADHLFSVRSERQKLLENLKMWFLQPRWHAEQAPLETLSTLVDSWEKSRDNDSLAVIFGTETWTYAQLGRRTDNLIRALRRQGVQPGDRIAVALCRSPDLIAAVIAIVKMGACYVPIDLAYPADRIKILLSISQPRLILCEDDAPEYITSSSHLMIKQLQEDLNLEAEGVVYRGIHDLGYIIFTSGSTGTPKGVMMGHGALAQLVSWHNATYRSSQRTLQFSPISFDVSFQEIFSTLAMQGCLVLIREEDRRDPRLLLGLIESHKVDRLFLPYVALKMLAESAVRANRYPSSLRDVFTAGEQLIATDEIRKLFSSLPSARLHNHYGPSETHVATALSLGVDPMTWPNLPSIGTAIAGSACFILDAEAQPVKQGECGELFLAGQCVGEGYFNSPEQSRARFMSMNLEGREWRTYQTGDLTQWNADGTIQFLGRVDDQVKIRGFRIELGEIEAVLQRQPAVRQAVVLAIGAQEKELVAVLNMGTDAASLRAIKDAISTQLPEYMRPQRYVVAQDIPTTPSGKIDRRSLAASLSHPAAVPSGLASPAPAQQGSNAAVRLAFAQLLGLDTVPADAHFFELGGTSILAIKMAYLLEEKLGRPISVVTIFEHPLLPDLVAALSNSSDASKIDRQDLQPTVGLHAPIAVIGMAARLPGAPDIAAFWRLLQAGQECITHFSAHELDPSIPLAEREHPQYVRCRGILPDSDCFDANFFKVSKIEAELIDPQQRVFLETAYHALEDGGYLEHGDASIGVFAGSAHNTYYIERILCNQAILKRSGSFAAMLANDKDYLATRAAYKLDLRGPAVDIQTGCSSSAVAIVQAVQALRSGTCAMALAGGVAIHTPVASGYLANDGAMLSPTGRCRPFSEDADGTIFSDGAGVVLLKPLADAERDGDRIYAVIRGVGINNDGAAKASFTAPSVKGQRAAVQQAWANAGLDPATARYIECHGTATVLGDPIEIEALRPVFARSSPSLVAIGSVKGNIGHTTAAAGVTGLIKTALCLYHRELVPSLHAPRANPFLKLEDSPFVVQQAREKLPEQRDGWAAGLSSFGVGGTNVHLVLGAGDGLHHSLAAARPAELLPLSGANPEALAQTISNISVWSQSLLPEEQQALARNIGRRPRQSYRSFLITGPAGVAARGSPPMMGDPVPPQIVWLFPGQGSQATGMGAQLAAHHGIFSGHLKRLATIAHELSGRDILGIMTHKDAIKALHETENAQIAIVITALATAYSLRDAGQAPAAMVGHSIGEIAAATFAGLWTDEHAIAIIIKRAQLMQGLERGGMIAAMASAERVGKLLHPGCDLAAINGPQSVVIAGALDSLKEQQESLLAQGIKTKGLNTSHAFHSRMMAPMVAEFQEFVQGFPTQLTKLPIYSTRLGRLATPAELCESSHWAKQVLQPVLFLSACQEVSKHLATFIALEVGSGAATTTMARRIWGSAALATAPLLGQADVEWSQYLTAVGTLWCHGCLSNVLEWTHSKAVPQLWAPPYPFARQSHLIHSQLAPIELKLHTPLQEGNNIMSTAQQRQRRICEEVVKVLEECSGLEDLGSKTKDSFLDLGLDSLFLTQASMSLGQAFGLAISFRQLSEDLLSIEHLTTYLTMHLAADLYAPPPAVAPQAHSTNTLVSAAPSMPLTQFTATALQASMAGGQAITQLVQQQMELMRAHVALLQGIPLGGLMPPVDSFTATIATPAATEKPVTNASMPPLTSTIDAAPPKQAFGAIARISRDRLVMSDQQRRTLDEFIQRYNAKTKKSKEFASQHRAVMADPRVVTGFRPNFKELIYPLVSERSEGPYIWDIDGHRYTDMLNGFGSNFFGYNPTFIKESLLRQIAAGYEIGPQFGLVGPASILAAELTGHDRVAWCNTGSEAVLGCLRIARTVTGKKKIVSFQGSYHGINDEVIVRSNAKHKPFPASPGIMPNAVENMLVLEYGTDESLAMIARELPHLAAVLVEPIQSRRPEFVPIEFWKKLREMTEKAGVALIFDEVITGFRYHSGGVQGAFGIQADLASYGKVVGGGLPIGMIAGRRSWMDALDGGSWSFGNTSIPEVGVTYFAGTFVRHPLAIAAALATLQEIKRHHGALQQSTNAQADLLCKELNQIFTGRGVPFYYCNFGSLMKLKTRDDQNPFNELLACWLRDKGIHIWDMFPNFMTVSHHDEHRVQIVKAFAEALDEMIAGGLFPDAQRSDASVLSQPAQVPLPASEQPPSPGARLGKTAAGKAAWFVPDPNRPGHYLQIVDH